MEDKRSFSEIAKQKIAGSKPEEPPEDPVERDWPLEDLGACASIAKNKWITALTVKHAAKPWESFQYRHIGARSTFEPTRFELYFVGDDEKWRVVVTGRNLERIYNLVIQHRLEWIRAEPDRDFEKDEKGYIATVTVEAVEEKKR
jgi:hypothetical protein